MTSKIQEPFLNTSCPNCPSGKLEEPDNNQEWILKCNECGAIQLCYQPLPHQEEFHADNAKVKAFFGG